jgi:hypothetical protein
MGIILISFCHFNFQTSLTRHVSGLKLILRGLEDEILTFTRTYAIFAS